MSPDTRVTRPDYGGAVTAIGFDLDMTLVDSRPGIGATLRRIAEESGYAIDVELATSRLGPPLDWELAHWLPADHVDRWADRYRELYSTIAIAAIEVLPGAHEAIRATNRYGHSMVVSAKHTPNVQLHVDHLGLEVGSVFGGAWREQKADVLLENGATMYVGDHEHDMIAARLAGVVGVGVTTGGTSAEALREAGADVVIASLLDFDTALLLLP